MRETLSNLVESYGYVALFVLIALESLGIPLPGESALVSAAAFSASGRLSLPWVVFVAAAALVPDRLWYLVEPFLPPLVPKPRGGRPRLSDRACLTGIVFVLHSGVPWRMLPKELAHV